MPIEWKAARFGSSYSATLAPGLRLLIAPDGVSSQNGPEVPFYVQVFDAKLKARFTDVPSAKAAAERMAKKLLTEALTNLEQA